MTILEQQVMENSVKSINVIQINFYKQMEPVNSVHYIKGKPKVKGRALLIRALNVRSLKKMELVKSVQNI